MLFAHSCGKHYDQGADNSEEMEEARSRKGYVPVLVGEREEDMEKIWVTIKAIQHLAIVELLEQSANEYGYQNGLLKIKCDPEKFKAVLHKISKKHTGVHGISVSIRSVVISRWELEYVSSRSG
ncbi:Auxin-responsive protein SAUR71 [Spatholobus suberectus]|nr:Auxin-responsive protein SAUR71 [Spatholobus suberectus]